MKRDSGTRYKSIPVEASTAKWRKDPSYMRAYAELEGEFALLKAVIAARKRGGPSQEQIAAKMKTSQAAAARLESGRGNPSLKTQHKYAAATGTRLRIKFEAVKG
jgi:ribosome-binding protein aMBF1 (putative translation factor)